MIAEFLKTFARKAKPAYIVIPPDFPGTAHYASNWTEALQWIRCYDGFTKPEVIDRKGVEVRYVR